MNDELLTELSRNLSLANDTEFSKRLGSELQNYYIGENVCIPENEIIKIIGKSKLDNNITLMPYQLIVLKQIEKNNKLVISAPTSFGKTFVVLEYIMRKNDTYNLIVYVVHTKSLKDELYDKIEDYFDGIYEVFDDIEEFKETKRGILIIVSDGQNIYNFDRDIDLLIVDEAYNLGKSQSQTRYFCIMRSYRQLLFNAKKCILIGPFISSIRGEDSDDFKLYRTDFSPVTAIIKEGKDIEYENSLECFEDKVILEEQKTIVYFGSKTAIYDFMVKITSIHNDIIYTDSFIEWMENDYPDFWLLPKIMHLGIGIYHSAFPKYINIYNMNQFNKGEFNGLLSTSSILEGVNTASKNLILYDTSIGATSHPLTPFQFFNLCGRVGRLGKEIVGTIYNFGDSYINLYEKRNMPLYIGNDSIEDDYDKFDENDEENNNPVKLELIEKLKVINIDYDNWYKENSFYSYGSKIMVEIIDEYLIYRNILKTDLSNQSLMTIKNEINKNLIIEHIYTNFINKIDNFKYHQTSKFYVIIPLRILLRTDMGGINFNMKKLCSEKSISNLLQTMDIKQKNTYVLELMKLAYDYIPHKLYNILFLFHQFVTYDPFWSDEEMNSLYTVLLNRINLYLNEGEDIYITANKILNNIGIVPSLSNKIVDLLKKDTTIVEKYTRKNLIMFIKNNTALLQLENHERINLKNLNII